MPSAPATLPLVLALASLACVHCVSPPEPADDGVATASARATCKLAPRVRTLVPFAGGGDALSRDDQGSLYVSDFVGTGTPDNANGTTVFRIAPAGHVTPFVTGLQGPAGSAFDAAGNFYVASYLSGEITKVTPLGERSTVAQGINGPVSLAFDRQGRLHVSVSGSLRPGSTVARVGADGTLETVVDLAAAVSPPVLFPSGLAFDADDHLFVANFLDGRVVRVAPDGAVTSAATVAGLAFPALGYLAFAGNTLYATGIGSHRIYALAAGEATSFAGTGVAGQVDGPVGVAQFDEPNGIVANRAGSALFIADTKTKSIRQIIGVAAGSP